MAAPSDVEKQEENTKKPMKPHLFRFGNYNRYYGYRMGRGMEEDPRLKFLRREWFEGKDCLDVGCNEGIVTISIVQKYNCNSMLGVDLDRGLIAMANDNLEAAAAATDHTDVPKESDSNTAEVQSTVERDGKRKKRLGTPKESDSNTAVGQSIVENDSDHKKCHGTPKEIDSNTAVGKSIVENDSDHKKCHGTPKESDNNTAEGQSIVERDSKRKKRPGAPKESHSNTAKIQSFQENSDSKRLRRTSDGTLTVASEGSHSILRSTSALQRVTFKEEQFIDNFPHGDYLQDGTFDTILCLSVTKWVHLNWGDEGLIKLFAKIFRVLRMGGVFILEPQPWKSYVSKNSVSEITRKTFREIVLRPHHFKELLLDKVGFKSVSAISEAVPNSAKGFNRALYVCTK